MLFLTRSIVCIPRRTQSTAVGMHNYQIPRTHGSNDNLDIINNMVWIIVFSGEKIAGINLMPLPLGYIGFSDNPACFTSN